MTANAPLARVLGGAALLVPLAVLALLAVVGRGTVHSPVAAAVPEPAVSWQGLPLVGSWRPTSLTLHVNALLTGRQRGLVVAATSDGLWRSGNGGIAWRPAGLKGIAIVSLAEGAEGGDLVSGSDDGVIYLGSQRRGSNWGWRRIGGPWGAAHPVFSLALSPSGKMILAGTFGSLYRGTSAHGRWRWQRAAQTSGDAAVTSIVWLPWATQRAAAAVFGVRPPILVSRDGGRTWRADSRGLPPALPTQTLLPASLSMDRLILTTMGDGVWRQDGRAPWRDMSAGLPERHAMPIVGVSGHRTTVFYAGTMGYGVYATQGTTPWRRIGEGLSGGQYTSLGIAMAPGPHPSLLVGTALGVYRYVPSHAFGSQATLRSER